MLLPATETQSRLHWAWLVNHRSTCEPFQPTIALEGKPGLSGYQTRRGGGFFCIWNLTRGWLCRRGHRRDALHRRRGTRCWRNIGPLRRLRRRTVSRGVVGIDWLLRFILLRDCGPKRAKLLSAGAFGADGNAQLLLPCVSQPGEAQRIAGGNHHSLLARGETNQDTVIKRCLAADDFNVCIFFRVIEIMKVNGCGDDLAFEKTPVSRFAALGQDRQPRAAFAQRPLQERVMAPADNRRRLCGNYAVGPRHAREQPTVEIGAREQPLAGHLGTRDLAIGDKLIEFPLFEAEIGCRFSRRKQLEACADLHILALNLTFDILEGNTRNAPESKGAVGLDGLGALELIWSGDANLFAIVGLSLFVTLSATVLAAVVGMPLGALVALTRFPGRNVLIVLLNGSMGLPPVVVGLVVFLLLSRSGPLGPLGILFTPQAMIVAQAVLIAPIIAALTRQVIEDLWAEYREELTAMDVGRSSRVATLLWDARFSLVTILLAGFGRAAAEVGAVMIVGGNIDGFTRVMTTTIALETSKGNLSLAVGLGLVLIGVILAINALAWTVRGWSERHAG